MVSLPPLWKYGPVSSTSRSCGALKAPNRLTRFTKGHVPCSAKPTPPNVASPLARALLMTSLRWDRGSKGISGNPSALAVSDSVLKHPPVGPHASSHCGWESPTEVWLAAAPRHPGSCGLAGPSVYPELIR